MARNTADALPREDAPTRDAVDDPVTVDAGGAELHETEAAILEAARDLIAEGGLSALAMRSVAARVGVTATAIYNYFESKSQLVDRVVAVGFERFESYLRAAIADLPPGSRQRLYALGEAYIRFALENREYFKILFTIETEHPREIDELPGTGGYLILRQTVEDAMEAGAIQRADPDLVALYLWAHVHGVVTLFLACELDARCPACAEDGRDTPAAARLFAEFRTFVREGLAPKEDGPAGSRVG